VQFNERYKACATVACTGLGSEALHIMKGSGVKDGNGGSGWLKFEFFGFLGMSASF
jgi:hypothetical protein